MDSKQLSLVASEMFFGLQCDFYKDDRTGLVVMTREQIGAALGYASPGVAICKIHMRHRDRLEKHSFRLRIDKGKDRVLLEASKTGGAQETVFYTHTGIMEICHMSRMPRANKFFDFVWDVMDKLVKKGSALLKNAKKQKDEDVANSSAPTLSSIQTKLWLNVVSKQLNILAERLETDIISLLLFIYDEIELISGVVVSDVVADYKKLNGITRCPTLDVVASTPLLRNTFDLVLAKFGAPFRVDDGEDEDEFIRWVKKQKAARAADTEKGA